MSWASLVSALITTGGNIAGGFLNKDANEAAAKAAEMRAMQELEKAKRNNRLAIIIAIGIVLILGFIIIKKA